MTTLANRLKNTCVAISFASGFFGFFHHAGVLLALSKHGIKPCKVTGTSAGAIVAGMYASGLEPQTICDKLLEINRSDFWDVHFPFTSKGFGLLAGNKFMSTLANILPVHNFDSCKISTSFGAYDLKDGRMKYINSGSLLKGICASCAVPYLFTPVEIDGRNYWDGGFAEKTPLVPLIDDQKIDTVIISHLDTKKPRKKITDNKNFSFLPKPSSFFAHTPQDEKKEREEMSLKLLKERGKQVTVLAPPRVWLGPFSLDRASLAMTQAETLTSKLLNSD